MLLENSLVETEAKVAEAIELLKKYEPPEGYYVAFSGGKDSVVILDLIKRAGVRYEAHHHIMTIEPPELMQFIYKEYPEVINDRPAKTMYQLIVQYGFPPLRQIRYCCWELKSSNGKNRFKVTGVRAEESPRRAKQAKVEIKEYGGELRLIHDWKAAEVWQYILTRNLPYCKLYDEGAKRIGCIFCPFAKETTNLENAVKYPQFTKYFVTACDRAIKVRLAKRKTPKYNSGGEMFKAWLDGGRGKTIEDFGYYFDSDTCTIIRIIDRQNFLTNNKSLVKIPSETSETNKASTATQHSSSSVASCSNSISFYRSVAKMSTQTPTISLVDFETILAHAEKISNGQFDFISVLRGELKKKLGIENADALIALLKTKPEGDIHNMARLFLAQFKFVVEDGEHKYYLRKFSDTYCELELIKPEADDKKNEIKEIAPTQALTNDTTTPAPTLELVNAESTQGKTLTPEEIFAPPTVGTVEELTTLFKNDMEQSNIYFRQSLLYYIKTGIDLIAIREKLKSTRGAFTNWLATNNLKRRTAYDYIEVAEWCQEMSKEQFVRTCAQMTPKSFLELTKLSHEDALKFIEEKAAEGNPVENMTVKETRAEIKKYKDALKKKEAEMQEKIEHLQKQADETNARLIETERKNFELHDENKRVLTANQNLSSTIEDLHTSYALKSQDAEKYFARTQELLTENEQLKNQPPQIVEVTKEVIPEDYQQMKKVQAELQNKNAALQKKLDEQTTIEVIPPADYEANKKEIEELKKQVTTLESELANRTVEVTKEEAREELETLQKMEQLFEAAEYLLKAIRLFDTMKIYTGKKLAETGHKVEQVSSLADELQNYLDIIAKENEGNKKG